MPMLKQQLDMPPTSARVLLLVSASEPPVEVEAPTDACAPRVLEIVPDVEPARVLGLAEHFIHNPVNARQNVLELEGQTEKDEEGAARGQPAPKIDYVTTDREFKGGIHYFELTLEQFMVDFSYTEAVSPNAAAKTSVLCSSPFVLGREAGSSTLRPEIHFFQSWRKREIEARPRIRGRATVAFAATRMRCICVG
ncbi:hypothetical protein BD769DRAFT_1380642 [Suillus cothurnatus]|nr:hypothetical protein BD769DRAFT_1380642 [Suillus cothurnatus]